MSENLPSAPRTSSPRSALGRRPCSIRKCPALLGELRKRDCHAFVDRPSTVHFDRSQLLADAEHRTNKNAYATTAPTRSKAISPCRLLPTAKSSLANVYRRQLGERDLVRFPPTRHQQSAHRIHAIRHTAGARCWRRSASCRSVQQLAERSRLRKCPCDVRPVKVKPCEI